MKSVFVDRMPANDTDTTVAYGKDNTVLHHVDRDDDGDKAGYPDQMVIEQEESSGRKGPSQ